MPCSRRTSSSTQSVNGQPVAGPDSMPTHSGVSPLAIISSISALKSVERLGDLVALLLPDARDVPHERLEVGLERHAVLRAVDVGERQVAVGPVLRHRRHDVVGDLEQVAVLGELLQLAGLREGGDVGRVAAEHLGVDLLLEVTPADVGDVDAVGLAELGQGVLHRAGLVLGVLHAEHRHRAGAALARRRRERRRRARGGCRRRGAAVVVAAAVVVSSPRCCGRRPPLRWWPPPPPLLSEPHAAARNTERDRYRGQLQPAFLIEFPLIGAAGSVPGSVVNAFISRRQRSRVIAGASRRPAPARCCRVL